MAKGLMFLSRSLSHVEARAAALGALLLAFSAAGSARAEGQAAAPAGIQIASAPPRSTAPPAEPLFDARLFDLGDRQVSLRSLAVGTPRVVVLLHQDRHSADQNTALKEALGQLVGRYADRLQVVALADVGGYDFWPAKGYVKDALRPLSAEGGVTVLCDWKGAVRKAYGLAAKQSAVFVIAGGELRHLSRGVLSPSATESLIGSIEQLVRG